MQLNYYHEAVEVVAQAIDQVIEDRENASSTLPVLDHLERHVEGWIMSGESRLCLLHLIQSTKILIEENA